MNVLVEFTMRWQCAAVPNLPFDHRFIHIALATSCHSEVLLEYCLVLSMSSSTALRLALEIRNFITGSTTVSAIYGNRLGAVSLAARDCYLLY
jgi:hypothetical protein